MKKGKIILGVAAFLVTAASTLAFKKLSATFQGRHVLGPTVFGGTCFTTTCFTAVAGLNMGVCHTLDGVQTVLTAGGANIGKLWTAKTAVLQKCEHLSKWTHAL